jgi:hypothetical protein
VREEEFAHLLNGNSFSKTSLSGARFLLLFHIMFAIYYALAVLSTVIG